jgi:hypothetical protein
MIVKDRIKKQFNNYKKLKIYYEIIFIPFCQYEWKEKWSDEIEYSRQ